MNRWKSRRSRTKVKTSAKDEKISDPKPHHISALISVGFGFLILGLAAPYIDNWLSHLTSLKSPLIELQLGSATSHKVSVGESFSALSSTTSLTVLKNYAERIEQDIDFVERFEKSETEPEKMQTARELLPAFKYLISPIAGCMQSAIRNGMSAAVARQMIVPVADNASRLIFAQNNYQAAQQHREFWRLLESLPERVRPFLKAEEEKACLSAADNYRDCLKDITKYPVCVPAALKFIRADDIYPHFGDFGQVPYLHVAAALLFAFVNDEDVAYRILQDADHGAETWSLHVKYKDFAFLQLAGKMSYYIGRPVPLENSYYGYFEQMRTDAAERILMAEKKLELCTDAACRNDLNPVLKRHWDVLLDATNDLTFFLAEDVARHSPYAERFLARAEEYGEWLEAAVKKGTKQDARTKYYAIKDEDKYYYIDTYDYLKLVLEARKSSPDVAVFKKLKREFEQVVEHVEAQVARNPHLPKIYGALGKAARSHLDSARELAGE